VCSLLIRSASTSGRIESGEFVVLEGRTNVTFGCVLKCTLEHQYAPNHPQVTVNACAFCLYGLAAAFESAANHLQPSHILAHCSHVVTAANRAALPQHDDVEARSMGPCPSLYRPHDELVGTFHR